jgi:hypothetical protein
VAPYTITYDLLPNPPGSRVGGRNVVHDSRSWDHRTGATHKSPPTKASEHACHAPVWDQGQVGDCTMNAALGVMMCDPFWTPTLPRFAEPDCLRLYSEETRLDDVQIPGHYPPDDTGSCGLYSMKVLKRHGWITGYDSAFGLVAALNTLVDRPISIGVAYYDSMERPDSSGRVSISPNAQVVGGHQMCVVGQDPADHGQIKIRQSWGVDFGDKGYIYLGWSDFDRLLHEQGDVITPKLPVKH